MKNTTTENSKEIKEIKISKELFIETIDVIKRQMKIDSKCCKAFQKILPNDIVVGYNNNLLFDLLVKILKVATNDTNDIEYFIYDLEFGKLWKPSSVTCNGKNIKMETVDDLWSALVENNNEFIVDYIEKPVPKYQNLYSYKQLQYTCKPLFDVGFTWKLVQESEKSKGYDKYIVEGNLDNKILSFEMQMPNFEISYVGKDNCFKKPEEFIEEFEMMVYHKESHKYLCYLCKPLLDVGFTIKRLKFDFPIKKDWDSYAVKGMLNGRNFEFMLNLPNHNFIIDGNLKMPEIYLDDSAIARSADYILSYFKELVAKHKPK